MCARAAAIKEHRKPVPIVSKPVFKQIPKYPPGIKISEVLKLTVELSTLSIPMTPAVPQYPPGIRIPEHLKKHN